MRKAALWVLMTRSRQRRVLAIVAAVVVAGLVLSVRSCASTATAPAGAVSASATPTTAADRADACTRFAVAFTQAWLSGRGKPAKAWADTTIRPYVSPNDVPVWETTNTAAIPATTITGVSSLPNGWGGCDTTVTLANGTALPVSVVPADGTWMVYSGASR